MSKITNEQRRSIYGIASQLGIYEKGNPDDNLHVLVGRVTEKKSIADLDAADAAKVIYELIKLKDGQRISRAGMITPAQEKKIWFFMYKLSSFDKEPSKVKLAYRLCKIIKKELKISACERKPFQFVSFENGNTLIEVIKKYVQYEERRNGVNGKMDK